MDDEYIRYDKLESVLHDQSSEPRGVPLEYLRRITSNFSNKLLLGEGGFGKVYKGVLSNEKIIAVKKLEQLKPGVVDRQFENEVYHLMKLKHPNIVRFVGYCYETRNECVVYNGKYIFAEVQERLLCLEYLPNGSLDRHLSDESSGLDWGIRYRIIKGICCGLHYLHEECKSKINASIVHLDLKPANILLDENLVPKVADFGLSRLFEEKTQTYASTLAGSLGYMAPEYIYSSTITTKADIYSLGVIIVEIITGSKIDPLKFNSETTCQEFVEHVLKNWRNRLEEALSETCCYQIRVCLEIGLSSIKFNRDERPTAGEIIEMLNRCESTNSYGNNETKLPVDQVLPDKKELLEISPLELHFCLELNKRIPCLVKLRNKTDEYVAFYFGVTVTKNNYSIEPTTGFLWPRSTFNVVVKMEEQLELPLDWQCNDEFLVQSIIVRDYIVTSKTITEDMFKNISSNLVNKIKLTVVYELPAQPLSISLVGSEMSSQMASSQLVEVEAAKLLHKLTQELEDDEPAKLATKLYVMWQDMKLSGKEQSLPHQIISRAVETLVNQHGMDALLFPSAGGPQQGYSSGSMPKDKEITGNQSPMIQRDASHGSWEGGFRKFLLGSTAMTRHEASILLSGRIPAGKNSSDVSAVDIHQGSMWQNSRRSPGTGSPESLQMEDTRSMSSQYGPPKSFYNTSKKTTSKVKLPF